MTSPKRKAAPAAALEIPADELPEGCVWMSRVDEAGGQQFAAVHQPSGSVDVMAEQGWALVEIEAAP